MAGGEVNRSAGDRGGDPPPFQPHRRGSRLLRPVFKVNPPLRPANDLSGVRDGRASGTWTPSATDHEHLPHPPEAKDLPLAEAPPGMLGLETALAVAMGVLHGNRASVIWVTGI